MPMREAFESTSGPRCRAALCCGLVLAVLLPAAAAAAQVAFTDVTATALPQPTLIQHTPNEPGDCLFVGGFFCEPERMSGGAAVADVDGDGWPDLFVTRLDAPDVLLRNRGDGTFEDITAASGLAGYDLQSNGAGFADIDNDGDPDLVVVVLGELSLPPVALRNFLFVNDGNGVFTEEAEVRGLAGESTFSRRLWGVAFGDYDRDGFVDVHTTEWKPVPFTAGHSRLYRNRGALEPGVFDDVTEAAGLSLGGIDAFASTFVDLDEDGWQDLAVAADFGTSQLFWNQGDGTFLNGTAAAGVGTDENGMGSAFADFDGDGHLDWFVTSIDDPAQTCETEPCNWGYSGNRLYRYAGGRVFADATDTAGVRAGYWGWGTVFLDADNDGDSDLVMTNGVDFEGTDVEAPFNDDPMRYWENDGTGVMTEQSAAVGLTDTGSGKGRLTFDYDRDGDQDLFVVNNGAEPILYRNDSVHANQWIQIEAFGKASNREAWGARVSVQATPGGPIQVREVGVGGHFLGQSEQRVHIGVGQPDGGMVHHVEVRFPRSGVVRSMSDIPTNRVYSFFERSGCGLVGLELLLPWACFRRARRSHGQ
ncbi:MAG: CRTAC1 family protein [Proteobacteria bacterium]|nr:CRTAC1 family protein [Pseudomonadota bacterium]